MRRKRLAVVLGTALLMLGTACSSPRESAPETGSAREESVQEAGDGKETKEEEAAQTQEQEDSGAGADSVVTDGRSFAQAHDAFTTTLVREENDDYEIPAPPEGLFDLVSYPSKVGDLAAYVSSDPGDGEKHPMIIWVVGGWGNGIDDFPWCYPAWDNDQTGSAFWQSGVLTMYPSFRGGCGNPGYYEALFGEVDDIVSAYEYAASLPYVDADRIYLGGHSTGGTRALLAAEYTDKFRSVFCFGAVDQVKYHNNSQFTFDKENEEEFVMRSPVHWLVNVKNPTFIIEGSEGNSINLKNIQRAADNENINCYIVEGADHFSVLAPITRLLADKILEDTGAEPSITVTQEELDDAMNQEPVVPLPAMTRHVVEDLGMTFSCPYIWEVVDTSGEEGFELTAYSRYEDDNVWDMAVLYITAGIMEDDNYLSDMAQYLTDEGYTAEETTVNGLPAIDVTGAQESEDGSYFNNRYVVIQKDDLCVGFDFFIHESYGSDADEMFQAIVDSISFGE